jgi:two-component system, NarL family, nitrate/nitrite response regulator NarL
MTSATVWLLHPNKLFREGMKRILSESPFLVIAEAAGVQNAGCLADAPVPDLVLLDLAGDGEATALRQLRAQMPKARLVILTSELSPSD